jgi:hypothetical protein
LRSKWTGGGCRSPSSRSDHRLLHHDQCDCAEDDHGVEDQGSRRVRGRDDVVRELADGRVEARAAEFDIDGALRILVDELAT